MLLLFLIVPLTGLILLNLLSKKAAQGSAFGFAFLIMISQMVLSLLIGSSMLNKDMDLFGSFFLIKLTANPYSVLMLFTIGLVSAVALVVGKCSNEGDNYKFNNLILIVLMGMNGVVMVNDLFSLYVFLEITAVTSFILIVLYKKRNALEGSFKYLIMSAIATVLMLMAISLIILTVGSLNYSDINLYVAKLGGSLPFPVMAAFVMFVSGLSIKAGLMPFHGWLPDAYMSAPSSVSVLLAGIVTKIVGVYTMLIVFQNVFASDKRFGTILMIFGCFSIVFGAILAIGQKDFKRMLAYSSISQVGYIILGIGIGTPLGILGAVFHFFNHASFKTLLFVNATAVEKQTGTRQLDKLGGLASKMPVTGGTSVVAFLSAAGIPPLAGFWSKLIIIIAAWQALEYSFAIIAIFASVLTLAYFLVLQRRVFFGELGEGFQEVKEVCAGIKVVEIVLASIIVGVGILFPFIFDFIKSLGLL